MPLTLSVSKRRVPVLQTEMVLPASYNCARTHEHIVSRAGVSAHLDFDAVRSIARCATTPLLLAAVFVITSAHAASAQATDSYFSCRNRFESSTDFARSDGSVNFYHGLAYFGGVAGLELGANSSKRWSRTNGFDTGIRSGLRLGGTQARKDADLASDFTLVFSAALLPAATIGARFNKTRDCTEAWDMFGDAFESLGLTLFVTEAVKFASGRDRPYTRECGRNAPSDASCGSDDRHRSFFSGHASLASAGAGLTCSYSLKRDAWGTSRRARIAPCALGIAGALTTGLLRVGADRHWATDLVLGFALGGAIGYFDTWGPLDFLKFSTRDSTGRVSSRGLVLPQVTGGQLGAQLIVIF